MIAAAKKTCLYANTPGGKKITSDKLNRALNATPSEPVAEGVKKSTKEATTKIF